MQQGGKHAGISRTGLGTSEPREGKKVCDFCFFVFLNVDCVGMLSSSFEKLS